MAFTSQRRSGTQLLLWLFIFAAFLSPVAGEVCASSLKIGIIGDQSGSTDLDASYGILWQSVSFFRHNKPDFVIHMGDMVESEQEPEMIMNRFYQAAAMLDFIQAPWYMVAGDHDVNPVEKKPNSTDHTRLDMFKKLLGTKIPSAKTNLYYSFNAGDYHFISLFAEQVLRVDPRWGNIFLTQILEDQLNWLSRDLEENKNALGTVVFVHQPLWYFWDGWKPIHDLLRRYGVLAVIAAHFHYNQDEGTTDGIRYIVVGATGADVKGGSAHSGSVHHVTNMTLNERNIGFELITIASLEPLEFSPRIDMDRVQAIDQMLSNDFFAFPKEVFLEHNKLVPSCSSDEEVLIKLSYTGNPFPSQVPINLEFEAEGVMISEPAFAPEFCSEGNVTGGLGCTLIPGARIGVANLSSVETFGKDLWTAKLILGGPTSPTPGSSLNLRVRMRFFGAGGKQYDVEKNLSSRISACD